MRVFLTGGTGLIGSHLAALLRERGHEIAALSRPESDSRFLRSVGAELVQGDVMSPERELAAVMDGCSAVVHSAAIVYRAASWQLYRNVNVDGTARVAAAAARAGVPRLLHVSSVAVYGGAGTGPVREDDWRARPIPRRDHYSRSKRLAEETVWEWHARGAIAVTSVRPVVVFGERDRLFTPRLVRLLRWPVVPVPGSGHSRVTVVYAGNVAHAMLAALERERSLGRAYNLAQDNPLTARDLIQGLGSALGRVPRMVPVPVAPLLAGAALADAIIRIVPGLSGPRLRRAVGLLTRGDPYDSRLARRDLDWGTHVGPGEAFARTAAWLRSGER